MNELFCGTVLMVAILALGRWRAALFACLFFDAIRDGVRKATDQQPVILTLIVGVVWGAALFGALKSDGGEYRALFRRYPQIKSSLQALIMALVPGALISIIRYENGWLLALVGIVSYLCPGIGVVLGYLWPRRVGDVYKWMIAYVLINAIVLIGTFLELGKLPIPGLGGLNTTWIRFQGTESLSLLSGFYRSPDVMGLHAAHVIAFGMIIALRPGQRFTWFWLLICTWATTCLLLSGRRKMIAIPAVFLISYLAIVASSNGRIRFAISLGGFALIIVGLLSFVVEAQDIGDEYTRYAATIATEGLERTTRSFSRIVVVTIEQSGWLGDGLGVATQGRHRLGVVTKTRDWQEDGVGRLFKELGIPGVVLIVVAIYHLVRACLSSIAAVPKGHPVQSLQFGIYSLVLANVASFVISHQAYSGDPSTILIAGFCLGIGLGLPRPVWAHARPATPLPPRPLVYA